MPSFGSSSIRFGTLLQRTQIIRHFAKPLYYLRISAFDDDPSRKIIMYPSPGAVGRASRRCRRYADTARHRPVWARAADDARILLREKRLSELQRVALRRDLDRIEAVLDGITKPASPNPPARSTRI